MNEEKQTQEIDEEQQVRQATSEASAVAPEGTAEMPAQEQPEDAEQSSPKCATVEEMAAEYAQDNGAKQEEQASREESAPDPLEEAKAKIAELEDRYLRCRAEFDNYRKRMAREYNEIRDQTRRQTITDFLTVYDYFAMGMSVINQAADVAILKQGMSMIWNEFQRVLDGFGVKEIESVGKPFDANFHEAVSQEASETVAEGTVLRQYKAAFKIGEKLLRPAVVVVSSGPAKPAEPAANAAEAVPAEASEQPAAEDK